MNIPRLLKLAGIVTEGDATKFGQDSDIAYDYGNVAIRNNYAGISKRVVSKDLVLKTPIKNVVDSNSDEYADVMGEYDYIAKKGGPPIRCNIDINLLIGTEKWLDMYTMKGGYTNNKIPVVLKYVNKYYIIDGNHRVAKSLIKGEQNIMVDLYDWDSYTQSGGTRC